MSELSNILANTDFEHISLEDLVHLEDSLQKFENTSEEETLKVLKEKISDKYISFSKNEYHGLLRDKIHEVRTGYKDENWGWGKNVSSEDLARKWQRNQNGWDANNGWKFHLDVVPNRNHPVTKKVSEFLLDLGVNHKIASGGENGKGMTVYVGSYEDINKLAEVVQERFGKDIYEPPAYTDQVRQEHAFQSKVYGRFVPGQEGDYPWDGIGVGPIYIRAACENLYFDRAREKAFELGLAKDMKKTVLNPRRFPEKQKAFKTERENIHLLHYCSHKLYAEALGSYYCGSDIDAFEKSFFGDKLPAKGTDKRQKWDEVAKTFVEEAKTLPYLNGNFFDYIKNFNKGYMPIDFSRLQQEHTTTKEKTSQEVKQQKKTIIQQEQEQKQDLKAKQIQKKTEEKVTTESKTKVVQPVKKTVAEEHISEPTPEEKADAPKNQAFKEPWRKFYQQAAAKEKAEYSEDKDSAYYKATLSRQNGEKLEVTATPQHNVSLATKDKDGKNKVPSYEDFNNLVLAVKEQGREISFGDIKTPEFRARLLLACLENGVNVKELPEFSSMEGLEAETQQRLAKHKMTLLRRVLDDKEKNGTYSGLSQQENEQRQKLEQTRQTVRDGKQSKQTDTPEYHAAKDMLMQRMKAMKAQSK